MELTDTQVALVQSDLAKYGVTMDDLSNSLLDHICCAIEGIDGVSFEEAYAQVLEQFGENGIHDVQVETFQLIYKTENAMKKTMYILGYLATAFAVFGCLFKIMHWPFAGPAILLSALLLNFGFLPMFFYDKYKRSISR